MKTVLDAWPGTPTWERSEMTKPIAVNHRSPSKADDPLATIAAQWTRIGVWLSVEPANPPVDVEMLIVRTARLGRENERLFVVAASWLAVHHGWVNGPRLAMLMTALSRTDRIGSAVAGALLTLASQGARGLAAGRASELDGAIEACRPLARPRLLFTVMEQFPALRPQLRATATPLYRRWGLWHNDESLKLTAIRPAGWLLRHVPELRVRDRLQECGIELERRAHGPAISDGTSQTKASSLAADVSLSRLESRLGL